MSIGYGFKLGLLFSMILLAGCMTTQSARQQQRQSQELASAQEQAQDQQSSHASESRQGTVSQPIIIICNQNNSPNGRCAVPRGEEPALRQFNPK